MFDDSRIARKFEEAESVVLHHGDWVLDPFVGSGTSIIAAIRHRRKGAGAEMAPDYVRLAEERIRQELAGTLKTRPMNKPRCTIRWKPETA